MNKKSNPQKPKQSFGKTKVSKGPISNADKEKIKKLVGSMSIDAIAAKLNRAPSQVEKYINEELGFEEEKHGGIDDVLKSSPEWAGLQVILLPDELIQFQSKFVALMDQYGGVEEVNAAEINQIFTLVKTEILADRNLAIQRDAYSAIRQANADINAARQMLEIDPEDSGAQMKLDAADQRLVEANQVMKETTKHHTDLTKTRQDLYKDLKSTRNQRVNDKMNQTKSIAALIKALQNEEFNEREGVKAELMKIATEKEKNRLSKPHKYADGQIDLPLLTPETILADLGEYDPNAAASEEEEAEIVDGTEEDASGD